MKTIFLAVFVLLLNAKVMAQKELVTKAFSDYGLDLAILNPELKDRPTNYSFDLKYTTISSEKEKVVLAHYDPAKANEERWTVSSINDQKPTAADIKIFKKSHSDQPVSTTKIDDSTILIERQTPDQLVISYKVDPATVPKEASFLKDCRNYLTINLKTKHLEELQMLNEKPVKIKILNAQKINLTVKYSYHEDLKKYLPDSEDLVVVVKLLGQETTMQNTSEYSNYNK